MLLRRLLAVPKPLNSRLRRSLSVSSIIQPIRLIKYTFGTTILTGLGFISYAVYESGPEWEKFRRTSYFWSHMIPVYLHYRYQQMYFQLIPTKTPAEEQQAWLSLHNKYCDYVMNVVLHQRGVYIKLGQIASTRPDIIPKTYLKKFAQLQDGVPAQPGEYARQMIEQAFGKPLEEIFSEFNPVAVGAATIGQAHEARLKGSNQSVIVKIQYPEVRRLFGLDFSTLKRFIKLAQPEHLPLFDEFEKGFQIEFDFRREARALDIIGRNIMPLYPNIVIPRPIPGMATEFVLVMEKLEGTKLVDALKLEQAKMAAAQGKTLEEFEQEMMTKYVSGELYREAKKKYTPSALIVNIYASLIRTINQTKNLCILLYNHSIVPIMKRAPMDYIEQRVFINPHEIIDLLNDVHAHEILIDGIFNGDPHPGNIFLLKNGKIGLIDFGQVSELSLSQRLKLAKLIVLLAEGTKEELIQHYIAMGARTRNMNPYVIEKLARLGFDRDDQEICEGKNAQLFFESLGKLDEIIQLPEGYLMAARVGLLLRGLGTWIQLPHSTAQKWLPIAKQLLEKYKDVNESLLNESV
ncbi:unnamed protein product [Rotaria socialis]|uniref:ABC1 atypical kinase-like domain-containing protein n=1 Tax=Rotaria socialis TaxID=392032 RepID=A0A818HSV0_9BILA|nr:unnamed protein product [Rotaria socialis]CAF3469119.1 unnamed protein product [Rotaria socialis]CAF3511367.1 unnamed protein product [Rotaria socialis]CAF3546757.1 unnamed protein product [Rotaria socialis]CAF3619298.1 unnamed protein product [Rotaria socialis]